MNPEDETSNDDASLDDGAPPQAPPERRMLVWVGVVFGANLVCLLMLAARSESPPNMRGYFDLATFVIVVGVAAFAIIRFLFLYPFRLLDLLVMVLTLSAGMRGAIEAANWIGRTKWGSSMGRAELPDAWSLPDVSGAILYVETCVTVACVLLGGAALGLRNCRLMNIQTPLKRAVVLVFGMAALPAIIGLAVIPFYLLQVLLIEKQTTPASLGWIVAWLLSFVVVVSNASFSIRTMALTTENTAQETKWKRR